MSLVIQPEEGRPIHFPKNRNAFEFDEEVAQIFENMAQRSIPMYSEVHRLHISILADRLQSGDCTVVDIGASTGRLFRVMRKHFDVKSLKDIPGLSCYAFDNSLPMVEKLRTEFPEVTSEFYNLAVPARELPRADIVVLLYVLQFIHPSFKQEALQRAYGCLKPGGVLVLGQKEEYHGDTNRIFQEEYIRFRLANGYTQEEIDAKTTALKGSQFLWTPYQLATTLAEFGAEKIVRTSQWMNFSTLIATKPA